MKIGIDIVDIDDTIEKISRSPGFLDRLLTPEEMTNRSMQNMCGYIAAKEAIIKVGLMQPGKWHDLQITTEANGEPVANWRNGNKLDHVSLSISHTKHTAIAIAIYEKN